MNNTNPCSSPVLGPAIHRELDRLRTVDWTERPPAVESPLGTLQCDYEEDLGTGGWVCLNGTVSPPGSDAPPAPEAGGHHVRIWIPQRRRR
jgi:hypothetical protein